MKIFLYTLNLLFFGLIINVLNIVQMFTVSRIFYLIESSEESRGGGTDWWGTGGAVQGLAWNHVGLPWWLFGKESACNAGDLGSTAGWGRSPEGGNGNPFQYSYRENRLDRGAGVLQSMGSQRLAHDWATKPSREGLAWSHADRKWKLGIWTQSHSNG